MKKVIYIFMTLCIIVSSIWAMPPSSPNTSTVSDEAYSITWNGVTGTAPSKNVVYDKIETLAGGHDEVTLNANITSVLGLSTQELSLDNQNANVIFAGPASGDPAAPTFRSLVSADIPNNAADTSGTATTATNTINTGITDDTTTDATTYLTWVTANTGNLPQKITSTKLTFNPSTGMLSASGGFNAGSSATPTLSFKDSDAAAGDDNATIVVDCTDTGNGTEDCDMTFKQQIAGVLTAWLTADADGNIIFGTGRSVVLNLGENSTINNGSAPTVNAAGEIAVDTTSDQIKYYGGAERVLPYKKTYSVVVPAVAATDDMLFVKLPYGITALSLDCIVSAATSATINIQECDSAGANCADMATDDLVCDTDGAATTTFGGAAGNTAASGAWLKLDVASISGTPGTLTATFTYSVVGD